MINLNQKIKENPKLGWIIFAASIIIIFILGLFASSILTRKAEALYAYRKYVDHTQFEPRNQIWGQNFPKEYESYLKTTESDFKSKYNGNIMIDMLEEDPNLVILWAGYGFSKDYNQGRGHYYAVDDIRNSLRTGAPKNNNDGPMPGTCWSCKSPDVPRLMNEIGIAEFYDGSWANKGDQIVNPIGCADCHDAKTMKLHISRPALIEAFARTGQDINKASHQEMRSLVCAQCHVEYYFKKPGNYLTFPWDKGMTVEKIEEYYDEIEFKDWEHKLSKAPMIKAQHPGYEIYQTGLHARRGVSCADCHMPYMSEGGQKFTDHHIQSPLNNIANSCQVCHRESEDELRNTVYSRQDSILKNRTRLEEILVKAHIEAKFAWDKGASQEQMQPVLQKIRHAQWRWDFAAGGHGNSFHSTVETARIIYTGLDIAQEARIEISHVLSVLGYNQKVPIADISSKTKAQSYLGMDLQKMKQEKAEFVRTIVPQWIKKAQKREIKY